MPSVHEEALIDLIAAESLTERSKLTRDATLDAIGIDSVDIASIAFEIEDVFGIEISNDEFSRDQTLGQLLDLLEAKIAAKKAAEAAGE